MFRQSGFETLREIDELEVAKSSNKGIEYFQLSTTSILNPQIRELNICHQLK